MIIKVILSTSLLLNPLACKNIKTTTTLKSKITNRAVNLYKKDISFLEEATAMYNLKDNNKIYDNIRYTSSIVKFIPFGEKVYVIDSIDTDHGLYGRTPDGYILMDNLSYDEADAFHPVDEIKYATEDAEFHHNKELNSKYDDVIFNAAIHLVGKNKDDIYLTESGYYIAAKNLMDNMYVEQPVVGHTETFQNYTPTYSIPTGGGVLTPSAGRIVNAWGYQETYYNLDLTYVIQIMRGMGFNENTYPYWIREDGVKMLGPYVMVAANLDLHPKGTIVNSSLGTGLVVDTGGFAINNPRQLDICVVW